MTTETETSTRRPQQQNVRRREHHNDSDAAEQPSCSPRRRSARSSSYPDSHSHHPHPHSHPPTTTRCTIPIDDKSNTTATAHRNGKKDKESHTSTPESFLPSVSVLAEPFIPRSQRYQEQQQQQQQQLPRSKHASNDIVHESGAGSKEDNNSQRPSQSNSTSSPHTMPPAVSTIASNNHPPVGDNDNDNGNHDNQATHGDDTAVNTNGNNNNNNNNSNNNSNGNDSDRDQSQTTNGYYYHTPNSHYNDMNPYQVTPQHFQAGHPVPPHPSQQQMLSPMHHPAQLPMHYDPSMMMVPAPGMDFGPTSPMMNQGMIYYSPQMPATGLHLSPPPPPPPPLHHHHHHPSIQQAMGGGGASAFNVPYGGYYQHHPPPPMPTGPVAEPYLMSSHHVNLSQQHLDRLMQGRQERFQHNLCVLVQNIHPPTGSWKKMKTILSAFVEWDKMAHVRPVDSTRGIITFRHALDAFTSAAALNQWRVPAKNASSLKAYVIADYTAAAAITQGKEDADDKQKEDKQIPEPPAAATQKMPDYQDVSNPWTVLHHLPVPNGGVVVEVPVISAVAVPDYQRQADRRLQQQQRRRLSTASSTSNTNASSSSTSHDRAGLNGGPSSLNDAGSGMPSRVELLALRPENEVKRIYVGNIPYTTQWQDLKDYLRQGGRICHVEIPPPNSDAMRAQGHTGRGFAIATFYTDDDAEHAIEYFNGQMFNGRQLRVGRTTRNPRFVPPAQLAEQQREARLQRERESESEPHQEGPKENEGVVDKEEKEEDDDEAAEE